MNRSRDQIRPILVIIFGEIGNLLLSTAGDRDFPQYYLVVDTFDQKLRTVPMLDLKTEKVRPIGEALFGLRDWRRIN